MDLLSRARNMGFFLLKKSPILILFVHDISSPYIFSPFGTWQWNFKEFFHNQVLKLMSYHIN
jgi:hypothetical protein